MSEEEKEAIDTLQNCIADYVIRDFCVGKYCPQEDACKNNDCLFEKAIDTVVNLIDKQQKEIEELKTITREYESYKCGKGNKIVIASKEFFINGFFKNHYISKDKIREKIKELIDNEKFEIEQYGFDYAENINLVVDVLKELLGEEKDE